MGANFIVNKVVNVCSPIISPKMETACVRENPAPKKPKLRLRKPSILGAEILGQNG